MRAKRRLNTPTQQSKWGLCLLMKQTNHMSLYPQVEPNVPYMAAKLNFRHMMKIQLHAREAEAAAPEESAPIHVPGASPPIPAPTPPPAREATQENIDAALQAWNGDADSKRRVQQHMTAHGREKDTAAWLRKEYGGDLPMFPVRLPGTGQYQHLPWTKVQRRAAQLVQKNLFLSNEEQAPDRKSVV